MFLVPWSSRERLSVSYSGEVVCRGNQAWLWAMFVVPLICYFCVHYYGSSIKHDLNREYWEQSMIDARRLGLPLSLASTVTVLLFQFSILDYNEKIIFTFPYVASERLSLFGFSFALCLRKNRSRFKSDGHTWCSGTRRSLVIFLGGTQTIDTHWWYSFNVFAFSF